MKLDDQQEPEWECDLVMKGGIASGVVYPPAILELARKYRFRGVGGASAGAIAAGAAAAAEYGRHDPKDGAGFRGLLRLRKDLENGELIPQLFEPAPPTRALFRFLSDFMRHGAADSKKGQQTEPKPRRVLWLLRVAVALVLRAPAGLVAGALLAGSIGYVALRPRPIFEAALRDPTRDNVIFALFLGALLAFCGGTGAILGALLDLGRGVLALRSAEETFFGFCSGSRGPDLSEDRRLTDWLHLGINQMAGYGEKDRPLTIDELASRKIDFRLVTTNVSLARPLILPNDKGNLFFHEDDMRRLFPPAVVEYLIHPDSREDYESFKKDPGARLKRAEERKTRRETTYQFRLPPKIHPLPRGGKLPVIVAVRLSLSFPILLSAVRLYSLPRSKFEEKSKLMEESKKHPPFRLEVEHFEENWFSDGGIAANFPLSIFDRWMPDRPTFGINLCDGPLPVRLAHGKLHDGPVVRFKANETDKSTPDPAKIRGIVGLLLSMLDTARNARDNAQMEMASYRERVVHVFLDRHEGGLNLEMDTDTLKVLGDKGVKAARLFVGEDGERLFDFDEHRWVRLLLLMDHLERELMAARETMRARGASGLPSAAQMETRLKELLDLQEQMKEWYRHREGPWCGAAERRMKALFEMIQAWGDAPMVPVNGGTPGEVAGFESADPPATPTPVKRFFEDEAPLPSGALRVASEI